MMGMEWMMYDDDFRNNAETLGRWKSFLEEALSDFKNDTENMEDMIKSRIDISKTFPTEAKKLYRKVIIFNLRERRSRKKMEKECKQNISFVNERLYEIERGEVIASLQQRKIYLKMQEKEIKFTINMMRNNIWLKGKLRDNLKQQLINRRQTKKVIKGYRQKLSDIDKEFVNN